MFIICLSAITNTHILDTKHEPPDPMELDPDFLRTLNLPQRPSTDSLESDLDTDTTMIDNWQMNEVFQDISSVINVCILFSISYRIHLAKFQ